MARKKTLKEKKDIAKILDTAHKRHLEEIRKENIKARSKRKRKVSDSSLDEIIKKVADEVMCENLNDTPNEDISGVDEYLKWKHSEYDTYNSIRRQSVINSIDILEQAIRDKKECSKKRWCSGSDSVKSTDILWATSSYIMRYIRSCILRHDWKPLSYLLHFLLSHKKMYFGYIKEVSIYFP